MAARLARFGEGVAHQVGGAAAGVAPGNVIAQSAVMAGMGGTLIDVDADQRAGILRLIASVAFAIGVTVADNAGSVRSTVDGVTRTLADEIDAVL